MPTKRLLRDRSFGKNPPKGRNPTIKLTGPIKAKGNPITSKGKIFGRPVSIRRVSS